MMESLRDIVILITNVFNNVIILYFFVANGTYTVLMVMSFIHVWFYQLRIGYAGLQEVRESPVTPPVAVIVPAFNEEHSIVLTVESLLRMDYPAVEIIVVDDGSTDGTLRIAGYDRLLWHNLPIDVEKLQVLPERRRKYPAKIDENSTVRSFKYWVRKFPLYSLIQRVRKLWK